MQSSRLKNMENRVMAEMADEAKIIETVVRAHFDTCDYTADKIKPFIAKAQNEQHFTQCSGLVSPQYDSIRYTNPEQGQSVSVHCAASNKTPVSLFGGQFYKVLRPKMSIQIPRFLN